MAITSNPFLEKRTDRTMSDQEFARLFSPQILEHLPNEIFDAGVHVLHSPPGGGKTTILRALTPGSLRGFWARKSSDAMEETIAGLRARAILNDDGPAILGIMISCAAGYADLPPGASSVESGVFRALLDCRVVLRTLRGLMQLLAIEQVEQLQQVSLEYEGVASELQSIPRVNSAFDLLTWAEKMERHIYTRIDTFAVQAEKLPQHFRFESVLWLEGVRFRKNGRDVAARRLLMLDDLHKLRESQRTLLKDELLEMRPTFPVWLAQRSIAFGSSLLSQGARHGRDGTAHSLEDLWSSGQQFLSFAKNVLDRRMVNQTAINSESLEPHLRSTIGDEEVAEALQKGFTAFRLFIEPLRMELQYREWLKRADEKLESPTLENLKELIKIRTQIARNQRRKQMRLDLNTALLTEELDEKDSSKEENAAEIFLHEELNIPYYFGIERLSALATSNVNDLLYLAAALYDNLKTKRVLRHREPVLSPREQEKALREAVRRKFEFVPRSHTQGTRAHRLLAAVGDFCRLKTFTYNAPYAPGVTGFKVSDAEYVRLERGQSAYQDEGRILVQVLLECVAENLLVRKSTAATSGRDAGSVFYLNRALCAHFGLPLQFGGWQEVDTDDLVTWMQRGPTPVRRRRLFE
jgi:hypothetical protein